MSTALELTRAGLAWERGPTGLIVSVSGTAEQTACVQAEVARRVPSMGAPVARDEAPRHGACDACLDAMEPWRSAWCELCELARKVALKARGVAL